MVNDYDDEIHPCFVARNERGVAHYAAPHTGRDRALAQRLIRAIRNRPLDAKLLEGVTSVTVVPQKDR